MLYKITVKHANQREQTFVVNADVEFNSPEYALATFEREGGVLVREEFEVMCVDSLDPLLLF
jgi:hypothetical protein